MDSNLINSLATALGTLLFLAIVLWLFWFASKMN